MSTPLAPAALGEWVRGEIAAAAGGTAAVLAGHYAIFTSGATAVDLLADGDPSPQTAAEMLAFTRFTWNAACEAVSLERARTPRLPVLVDDIQFVRPALGDRAASERLAAALAGAYMSRMRTLPPFHTRILRERGLGDALLLRRDDQRWVFSERELRAAAVTHIREHLRRPSAASLGLRANADESRIEVTLPEHGSYCLVHSGNTTCAGGYLELLSELHRRGVRTLIALVPMRCLGPVMVGTTLAQRLLAIDDLSVATAAVPDVATGADAVLVRNPAR